MQDWLAQSRARVALASALVAALCGCSSLGAFKARYGDLTLVQGKDVKWDTLTATRTITGTNGVISTTTITVKGYNSNANVEAMKAENERYKGIASGAAEGLGKAFLDKYGPPSLTSSQRVPLPSVTLPATNAAPKEASP